MFHKLAGRDLVAEGHPQAYGGRCALGAVAHRAAERRGGLPVKACGHLRRDVGGEGRGPRSGGHKDGEYARYELA